MRVVRKITCRFISKERTTNPPGAMASVFWWTAYGRACGAACDCAANIQAGVLGWGTRRRGGRLAIGAVPTDDKSDAGRMKLHGGVRDERERIEFLLQRDGLMSTLGWADRTMRIYRSAVLNKHHHASLPEYRHKYIQSYCDFKHWLAKTRGQHQP